VIGFLCYAANVKPHKDKFENRGVKCVLIGYLVNKKGYKLYNWETKEVFLIEDMVFEEQVFPFKQLDNISNEQSCPTYPVFNTHPLEETVIPNTPLPETTPANHLDNNEPTKEHVEEPIIRAPIPSHTFVPVRKSTRSSTRPAWLQDFVTPAKVNYVRTMPTYPLFGSSDFQNIPSSHVAFLANVFVVPEPTYYKQAIQHKRWVKAIEAELAALERNETWTVIEVPPCHKPITSKWVYKTKYQPTRVVDILKARLVVKGFNQKEGLD
ncbi:retrovirus-related pol polyprotein from transposon TNT 1-94, partial [Tanacetum coccineum]